MVIDFLQLLLKSTLHRLIVFVPQPRPHVDVCSMKRLLSISWRLSHIRYLIGSDGNGYSVKVKRFRMKQLRAGIRVAIHVAGLLHCLGFEFDATWVRFVYMHCFPSC